MYKFRSLVRIHFPATSQAIDSEVLTDNAISLYWSLQFHESKRPSAIRGI